MEGASSTIHFIHHCFHQKENFHFSFFFQQSMNSMNWFDELKKDIITVFIGSNPLKQSQENKFLIYLNWRCLMEEKLWPPPNNNTQFNSNLFFENGKIGLNEFVEGCAASERRLSNEWNELINRALQGLDWMKLKIKFIFNWMKTAASRRQINKQMNERAARLNWFVCGLCRLRRIYRGSTNSMKFIQFHSVWLPWSSLSFTSSIHKQQLNHSKLKKFSFSLLNWTVCLNWLVLLCE